MCFCHEGRAFFARLARCNYCEILLNEVFVVIPSFQKEKMKESSHASTTIRLRQLPYAELLLIMRIDVPFSVNSLPYLLRSKVGNGTHIYKV